MTGLKTSVQLLGGNKHRFIEKSQKDYSNAQLFFPFQKSNKYSGVHLNKCDYCCSKLFTQTDGLLIWQHVLKCDSFLFFLNKLRKIKKI